ncbi:phage recombination protein Bet [Sporolactobacillus terrae]|uniref:phage recombination protein Bet n=1 Tax=Sporolactobacillus terrae TaxID=269673 RepID=UPI001CBF2012|nr:phage recombination protein Bet [Sporolactobacillus terrae]UAK17587.1 phage recombination protein Bet [Sporolactobacillus terrae]
MANEQRNDLINTEFEANGEKVKLDSATVVQYLVRGNEQVTKQEVVMFINLCKYQKLNPFLNEAYLVKFKGAPAQIITSKEAFMKRAEANEHYAGLEAGIMVDRGGEIVNLEGAVKLSTDKLIGGWAKVFRNDRKVPVKVQISFDEFSKGQATWKQMPLNMIRKTAIVNAMREAFPGNLGSMYTEEESQAERKDITAEVNQEVRHKANQEIIDIQPDPVEEPKQEKQSKPRTQTVENDPVGDFEQASKKAPF